MVAVKMDQPNAIYIREPQPISDWDMQARTACISRAEARRRLLGALELLGAEAGDDENDEPGLPPELLTIELLIKSVAMYLGAGA